MGKHTFKLKSFSIIFKGEEDEKEKTGGEQKINTYIQVAPQLPKSEV